MFDTIDCMRYLVIDTETTGLNHLHDRVIDFAAVPIEGLMSSINTYQQYFNPGREIHKESFAIHGLSNTFLKNYPGFEHKAVEIKEYLKGAILIAHNATFDIKFLNAEFGRCGLSPLDNTVIDTLVMARSKYPGKRAGLDALCTKFNISTKQRQEQGHGALLDAKLLSLVYLAMMTDNGSSDTTNDLLLSSQQSINTTNVTNRFIANNMQIKISDSEKARWLEFKNSLKV